MSNEQWKTSGDCTKCRKQKYCSHECSVHKKAINRAVMNIIAQGLVDALVGEKGR